MSIPVAIDRLAETLVDFDAGYLLTTADGRVKAVSVVPEYADGALRVTAPGRGSVANVSVNPVVTLLYPPRGGSGFSLLVDGTASVDGDDVVVVPASAVLHKPAGGAA
jgi:hypothetical protein